MSEAFRPIRFVDAEIRVHHLTPPALSKKPHAPESFDWEDRTYTVLEAISSWTRYERRGRMADNMAPAHAEVAARRGSWGVGRFYFRLRTDRGIFDLYYDRQPDSAGDRAGHWFLWREVETVSG